MQNEFTNPGDTTVISGDNFDLYGITVEQADVRIGNAICTVIDATRSDITLQIPANAQPNTDLTIQGGEMAEPVAIPYMNTGHQIFDFNDWPGSGGFTHSSQFPDNTLNFLCDGTEGDGYPEPLNEGMKYLRFHGNVGAWGWMVLWAGYIQVPAEVAADPAAYNLCFEVCTNASYPLNSTTRIALGNFMWMPGASGIPVNTGIYITKLGSRHIHTEVFGMFGSTTITAVSPGAIFIAARSHQCSGKNKCQNFFNLHRNK